MQYLRREAYYDLVWLYAYYGHMLTMAICLVVLWLYAYYGYMLTMASYYGHDLYY